MKIGVISATKDLPWTAPDEVMLRMAIHAAVCGHQVYFSARRSLEIEQRLPVKQQRSIVILRRHAFRPARVHQFLQKYHSSFQVFERNDVDVVVVSAGSILDAYYQPEILLYAQRTKLPVVYFCHGHSPYYEIPDRDSLRSMLGRMAAVVFAADANRKELEFQLAADIASSHVIRNACPFLLEHPLPWPGEESPARFAIVARLDAFWKGHETLLRILSTPTWRSRDWLLDCYGEGKDKSFISELATYLGISDRVRIVGHISDIKDVWASNHALLLPTKAESFSLAVLEALMCGRPVVCSDVGDLGEAVKSGYTGFIAADSSLKAFEESMERLWQSRPYWRELGLRGHNLSRLLHHQNPSDRLVSLLASVISNRPR